MRRNSATRAVDLSSATGGDGPPSRSLSDGSAIPVLAFRVVDPTTFTVFHLSERLRSGGMAGPAYTSRPYATDVAVLRIVVREGFGMDRPDSLGRRAHEGGPAPRASSLRRMRGRKRASPTRDPPSLAGAPAPMRWRRSLSWRDRDLGVARLLALFMVGSALFAVGSFPVYAEGRRRPLWWASRSSPAHCSSPLARTASSYSRQRGSTCPVDR